MTPVLTTFCKVYDGESIVDLNRDIIESFDGRFNPAVFKIPTDEYGFMTGKFVVSISWMENIDEE